MLTILFLITSLFAQNANPPLPSIVPQYVSQFRTDFDVRDGQRQDYRPLLANVVRLAFHYCVGDGGCDGCINMNQPDNAGLELSVNYLDAKVDDWLAAGLSKADLYALASMVAANMALGNAGWDSDLSNFEFGRTDCAEGTLEEEEFPAANGSPFQFFADNFGFSPRDTTVILGAHTLGRALPGNSGFRNFWADNALELGNGFYDAIERNPWRQIAIPGGLNQWDQNRPGNNPNLMALNADMYLIRNFDVDANGRVTNNGCRNNFNQCDDAPTLGIVEGFLNNQGEAQFQAEFKEVYVRMLRAAGQGLDQDLTLLCETFDCSRTTDDVANEVTTSEAAATNPPIETEPITPSQGAGGDNLETTNLQESTTEAVDPALQTTLPLETESPATNTPTNGPQTPPTNGPGSTPTGTQNPPPQNGGDESSDSEDDNGSDSDDNGRPPRRGGRGRNGRGRGRLL